MSSSKFDRRSILGIVFAHASVDMHTISLVTLLPFLRAEFNLDYATAAALITANNVVIAIAQPLFGAFGDRTSVRWLALAGCAVTGLAMISITWLPSYALVVAAAILSGLGSALFHPEALANTRAFSGDQPTTGTSWFFLGGNIGFGVGPLLVGVLTTAFGPHGAVALIIPTLIGVLLLFSQLGRVSRKPAERGKGQASLLSSRTVLLLVGFLLLLIVLRSVAIEGLKTFIPLYYVETTGKTAAAFAPLLTALSLSGIIGTLFSGPLADRIGQRTVMVGAMAIASAAVFVMLRTDGVLQLLAMTLFGIASTAPWTITVTMVQDAMPNNLGLAGGLTLGTAYGAAGLGVGALGLLANQIGLAGTLTTISFIPLLVMGLSIFVPNERQKAAGHVGVA
jgi:MFS transporter, FSR family, fosmidomycin resistance protein